MKKRNRVYVAANLRDILCMKVLTDAIAEISTPNGLMILGAIDRKALNPIDLFGLLNSNWTTRSKLVRTILYF
jgi:hypothetical protein